MKEKPECELIGTDGNIFSLVSIAKRTLRKAGQKNEAQEMQSRVLMATSYDDALSIIGNYVEIY